MPLDFDLINSSIIQSEISINNRKPLINQDLYQIKDFIPNAFLSKLLNYAIISDNWLVQEGVTGGPVYNNRYKINWHPDSVVEELHIIFENLTQNIENIFKKSLKFDGISIWKDLEKFELPIHADNQKISASIQIYLNDCPSILGTTFFNEDKEFFIPFEKNNGYLVDNRRQLLHYVATPVPAGITRYSVNAIWIDA